MKYTFVFDEARANGTYYATGPRGYNVTSIGSALKAGWPNGKALDYESRDCRFDPCVGHSFFALEAVG